MSSPAPTLTPDQLHRLRSHATISWGNPVQSAINIGGQELPNQQPLGLNPQGPSIGPTRTFTSPRLEALWSNARRANDGNGEAPNSWADSIKRIGHFVGQLLGAPELNMWEIGGWNWTRT